MSTRISDPTAAPPPRPHGRALRWLLLAVLALACAVSYRLTSRPQGAEPAVRGGLDPSLLHPLTRDERLFQTAQQLAVLADTPAQEPLAAETQDLADEVVDTSFSIALAQAAAQPQTPGSADTAAAARISQAQMAVGADKSTLTADQQAAAKAKPVQQAQAQGAVAIAQAQLGLDQDRLLDARNDASRDAGGPAQRITQMQQQHEASHAGGKRAVTVAGPAAVGTAHGLVGQLGRVWQRTAELGQLRAAE
ncbi:MAG: hypothetical protein ACRD1L_10655, partial [Terriglobales bacterium]